MIQKLSEESVAKLLHSLWTQHNNLLETLKEGEKLPIISVFLYLLVLAY